MEVGWEQFSALKDSVTIPNGMVWILISSLLFIGFQSIGTYRYGPKTERLGEPLSSTGVQRRSRRYVRRAER